MTTKRTPKFRHHKASGQGFVMPDAAEKKRAVASLNRGAASAELGEIDRAMADFDDVIYMPGMRDYTWTLAVLYRKRLQHQMGW